MPPKGLGPRTDGRQSQQQAILAARRWTEESSVDRGQGKLPWWPPHMVRPAAVPEVVNWEARKVDFSAQGQEEVRARPAALLYNTNHWPLGSKVQPLLAAQGRTLERASHLKPGHGQERVCPACHTGSFSHRFPCIQGHQDQAQHQLPKEAASCLEMDLDLMQAIPVPGVLNFSAFALHPYFHPDRSSHSDPQGVPEAQPWESPFYIPPPQGKQLTR